MVNLFVYGSMKNGFRNHWRVEGQEFVGLAVTEVKYAMHPAEHFRFPYVLEKVKKYPIHGELYRIDEKLLVDIDVFEGVPKHYYRKEIEVACGNEKATAFMYFRSDSNPNGMVEDIHICEWTKEFEKTGDKLEDFQDQLQLALLESLET